jgi:Flp pilus assembly pilin Flp
MQSRIKKRMMEGLSKCRLRRNRGAMSIEYALLASCIAAAIVLLVFNLGNQVRLMIESGTRGW